MGMMNFRMKRTLFQSVPFIMYVENLPPTLTSRLLRLPLAILLIAAVSLAACDSNTLVNSDTSTTPAPAEGVTGSGSSGSVAYGPGLQSTLDALDAGETLTVVVSFDNNGPLSQNQVSAVESLGISQGITFQSLPIMGVVATAGQVQEIAGLDGVVSIWPNSELEYHNEWSTEMTGVNDVRNEPALFNDQGEPLTGAGTTVLVNDSGIDATHGDLQFGSHVVQNVQGAVNLNSISSILPVTYLEDQLNSDLGSGHGTHVAGTVGGTGAQSDGKYEGVAPGADLVGYGSGAAILVLDALGGFDYALSNQDAFEHEIRIITNSWGTEGAFDPADPINIASYAAYNSGMTVVFSAGNSGPGENTLNPYSVAPWTISVGAGDVNGELADFSSRGVSGGESDFTMPDGTSWTAVQEPDLTGPGVDVISARATTNVAANGNVNDVGSISLMHLPYYTMISGTSMSAPHVAGIASLMLEVNPALTPDEVKQILRETTTEMPGYNTWEAGTGYVNAYDAVVRAMNAGALTAE